MKKAIIALDGGGSNLRLVVADYETEEQLYFSEINTGTNLNTVADREEALNNIQKIIIEGYHNMPEGYELEAIGFSSAGTEIKKNVEDLNKAMESAVNRIQAEDSTVKTPTLFLTNDIDILLHSSDIALVAGTGAITAVKCKNPETNEEVIEKFDGDGENVGDKGSGFWIAKEVLTRVGEIEKTGRYVDRHGNIVRTKSSCLRDIVLDRVLELNGYSEEERKNILKDGIKKSGIEYIAIISDATTENGKVFDKATVGKEFAKFAEDAAMQGDEAAIDILKKASLELFKNIDAAYERAELKDKKQCELLLSGSAIVKNKALRYMLNKRIQAAFPNMCVKVNKEQPVLATIKYVKKKLESKVQEVAHNENDIVDIEDR